LQSIFGLQLSQPVLYIAALAVILLLLVVFAWVLRRIVTANRGSDAGARGRQPRLGIVDTFAIDRQRQLVIVRRDSVEHLLLLGGTSDIVIESNLIRAQNNASTGVTLRDSVSAAKPVVVPNGLANTKPNTLAELSFAPEPREPAATASMPVASMQIAPIPPAYKVTPSPMPSDLTEIAQRFQNSTVTPLVSVVEPTAPASPPAPMPTVLRFSEPMTARHEDAVQTPKLYENAPEPIVPASERAETASPIKPETRDIGSLNDTLRQLLGRTRDS